jgi:hypothetical protein
VLWLQFSDGNDLGVGAELLIVAEGDVVFDIEVFQQSEAYVNLHGNMLRQPDFVIDAGLLDEDAPSFSSGRRLTDSGRNGSCTASRRVIRLDTDLAALPSLTLRAISMPQHRSAVVLTPTAQFSSSRPTPMVGS